jgi:outer membrane protein assembly factor BamB
MRSVPGFLLFCVCPVVLVVVSASSVAGGADAIGWRGDGTGCYPQADVPTTWDSEENKNILWRADVGIGQSSPACVGGRIFLGAEQDLLVCVDAKTGKVLWRADNNFASLPPELNAKEKRPPSGKGGGYSVATPATDGAMVYMCHATGIVATFDVDGKRKWVRYFDVPQITEYGRSSSPVLAGGKVVVTLGGLIALDAATGKTAWECKQALPAYGTPAVAAIGSVQVLITPSGDAVRLADGKVLASKLGLLKYGSPVVHAGVVYFADAPAVALRLPAEAGETLKFTKLWDNDDLEGEFFASPLWHDGLLYVVSNEGLLYVLDAATGKAAYTKKLEIPSAGSPPGMPNANLYASPALVGKNLLLTNDAGQSLLVAPGKEYKEIGKNFTDAGSGACPVADGKVLLLRGGKWLWAVGAK